jgi:pyruvate dehydrogenase E1 component alpha subunit
MPLSDADLGEMLYRMILIREFDERAIALRTAGKIYGVTHPYVGQEAVAVGVCAALTDRDRLTSTHRGHGHCIAKGADLNRMMAELFGRVDGSCHGRGGSMHIADFSVGMLGANGIVGAGLPIAAGAALVAQLEGAGNVAVAFFGDGAVSEGEYHETLHIAALWQLPLILVCENNLYAVHNAADVQVGLPDIAEHGKGYGIPAEIVDGNDVLAVYAAAAGAVERARRGAGPTLLECRTYRWHFHAMTAQPMPDRRPADEVAAWKARDPIARLEAELRSRGAVTEGDLGEIRARVARALAEAEAFAEASPFPDPADLLVGMYAE